MRDATASEDRTTQAILDATRSSILDFGVRRTTLSDVARRASVSRMTVYRRYPDVDAVLRDLMTREFGAVIDASAAAAQGDDGRTRLVRGMGEAVRTLRHHPLLRKVADAEPELLMPYVLGRMGETQRLGVAALLRGIAEGQADGSIRAGDPRLLAQSALLVIQSFLLSAGIAEDVDERALLAELDRVLDAALR
jgi:AcrR family transcriptional regulator